MSQHNKERYPAIWAEKETCEKELAGLMLARGLVTDEIKELQKEIHLLETKKQALNKEAMKDAARIKELRSDIARFAKAMGARG